MEKKHFVGFYNPSVILTYMGLASAFVSMFFSANQDFKWAIFFLMGSGLCDMFDGTVARMIKRTEMEKAFGIQLDSLCDLVCFGVAPAMIAYHMYGDDSMRIFGLACGFVLTLCGLIRLAFFNVTEEERQKTTTERRTFYQGLPITCSSLGAPVAYVIGSLIPGMNLAYFFSFFMLFIAFLFVFNFKVPKVHGKGNLVMVAAAIGLFVLVFVV